MTSSDNLIKLPKVIEAQFKVIKLQCVKKTINIMVHFYNDTTRASRLDSDVLARQQWDDLLIVIKDEMDKGFLKMKKDFKHKIGKIAMWNDMEARKMLKKMVMDEDGKDGVRGAWLECMKRMNWEDVARMENEKKKEVDMEKKDKKNDDEKKAEEDGEINIDDELKVSQNDLKEYFNLSDVEDEEGKVETMNSFAQNHVLVWPPAPPKDAILVPIGGLEKCHCSPNCKETLPEPAYMVLENAFDLCTRLG